MEYLPQLLQARQRLPALVWIWLWRFPEMGKTAQIRADATRATQASGKPIPPAQSDDRFFR